MRPYVLMLAEWAADANAASIRICVQPDKSRLHGSMNIMGSDLHDIYRYMFRAVFNSADALAEALQQPCRQVGLTCHVEDGPDLTGTTVVMRRMRGH